MTDRLLKLRGVVESTNLCTPGEKVVLLTNIDVCRAEAEFAATRTALNSLLAFGSKPSSQAGLIDKLRFYSRTALAVTAINKGVASAQTLRNEFDSRNAGDLEFAKIQFRQVMGLANAFALNRKFLVAEADRFGNFMGTGRAIAAKRITSAVTAAIAVMDRCIEKLGQGSGETEALMRVCFGVNARMPELKKQYEAMLARSLELGNPIRIQPDGKDSNLGSSAFKSNVINLGRLFFIDTETAPASSIADPVLPENLVRAKDAAVEMYRAKREAVIIDKVSDILDQRFSPPANFNELANEYNLGATDKQEIGIFLTGFVENASNMIAFKNRLAERRRHVVNAYNQFAPGMKGDLRQTHTTPGTIIHELSHMVLNTDDMTADSLGFLDQICYGPVLCAQLALANPNAALKNADNYAQFAQAAGFAQG